MYHMYVPYVCTVCTVCIVPYVCTVGVTAVLAVIVFFVYLYSYDEFCSILYSYLIVLGELYLLHCLVRVVIARWCFALPYYS